MRTYASGTTLQNLSLVEIDQPTSAPPTQSKAPVEPTASVPAPVPVAVQAAVPAIAPASEPEASALDAAARPQGPDRFLQEAVRELESGRIEQPLWVRAMDQAGGDAGLAKEGYLRARAAALRLERRARHAERAARKVVAAIDATERAQDASSAPGRVGSRTFDRKRVAMVAGAAVVLGLGAWLALRGGGDAPAPAAATAARKAAPAQTPVAKESDAEARERQARTARELAAKVQDLKAAENWHVMVLHAVEWTRAQPDNAEAWQELASGYVKLRQFDDAQEAARKAAELGPNDYRRWQELGLIHVALNQAVPALAAFERAVEQNPRDVTSLVQIGALRLQQGHLAAARAAYAKALELNPADTDALCGSAVLARKDGRAKDAEAHLKQVAASGGACPERMMAEAAAPAPAPPPPKERGTYGLPSVTPAPASAPPKKR